MNKTSTIPDLTGPPGTVLEQSGVHFSPGSPSSRETVETCWAVDRSDLLHPGYSQVQSTDQKDHRELQRNAEPTQTCRPGIGVLMRSQVCISSLGSGALYLGALPRVDEAVDHAEVVERGAEGTALARAGAGRKRAVVGRSLAAATAAAGTQL